jgi:hypothetical protein
MGKLLKTAMERWLASKPADERDADLEPWLAPERAVQPARGRRLVLDPATGQIKPKVDPAIEREAALKQRLKTIQLAEGTYD